MNAPAKFPGYDGHAIERFWRNVMVAPSEQECWVWRGPIGLDGYGKMWIKPHHLRAHRVAFEIAKGPIPNEMLVCHSCDNRVCVNPSHLWLGTQADNVADCVAKGRNHKGNPPHPRGESHPGAKLTPAAVLAIRASTSPHRQLASEFGVSRGLITQIKTGRAWAWL